MCRSPNLQLLAEGSFGFVTLGALSAHVRVELENMQFNWLPLPPSPLSDGSFGWQTFALLQSIEKYPARWALVFDDWGNNCMEGSVAVSRDDIVIFIWKALENYEPLELSDVALENHPAVTITAILKCHKMLRSGKQAREDLVGIQSPRAFLDDTLSCRSEPKSARGTCLYEGSAQ